MSSHPGKIQMAIVTIIVNPKPIKKMICGIISFSCKVHNSNVTIMNIATLTIAFDNVERFILQFIKGF